jgi:uncharacterized protein (TIGR02270 family)
MLDRPIPWDIYEEHLDEAAFLWEQWEHALSAQNFTLAEVAAGPEERLLAHLDALVIGGSSVADELCVPALESDEMARVAAAAWVLLHVEGRDRLDDSWQALSAAEPARRDAMARAFALCLRADLPARLSPRFDALAPPLQACLIDVLRIRDASALARLPWARLVGQSDPELLGAVSRAARRSAVELDRSAIERGLASELSETRSAAIELGTLSRHEVVRSRCRSLIAESAPERRLALAALAIGGDPQDQQRLLEWSVRDIGQDAVWALGFSGQPAVAEALLAWLDDPRLCASAAESFATITGLELDGELVEPAPPEPEEVADDAPLREPEPGDDLPRPDAPRVRAWWQQNAGRFEGDRRYFGGRPWAPTLPVSTLASTATWRLRGARLGLSRVEASSVELRDWVRRAQGSMVEPKR